MDDFAPAKSLMTMCFTYYYIGEPPGGWAWDPPACLGWGFIPVKGEAARPDREGPTVRGPPRTGEGSGPRGGQEADASGHEETRVETHRRDFSGQVWGCGAGAVGPCFGQMCTGAAGAALGPGLELPLCRVWAELPWLLALGPPDATSDTR